LAKVKALMLASGADAALLSGSGSALFAVVRPARIEEVQQALERKQVRVLRVQTF
jgi:homoserine kinase